MYDFKQTLKVKVTESSDLQKIYYEYSNSVCISTIAETC